MHDSFAVRRVQPLSNLYPQRQARFQVHRASANQVFEGGTVKELHRQESAAVLFSDVVDGADIGMIQRRRCLRFALKAGQDLRVAGDIVRQKLQRHKAMQAHVFSFVDDSHSASTELLEDAVVRNCLPDHWRTWQVNGAYKWLLNKCIFARTET